MSALAARTVAVFDPKADAAVAVGDVAAGSAPARLLVVDPEVRKGVPVEYAVGPGEPMGTLYAHLERRCAAGERYLLLGDPVDGAPVDRSRRAGDVAAAAAARFGACRGSPRPAGARVASSAAPADGAP